MTRRSPSTRFLFCGLALALSSPDLPAQAAGSARWRAFAAQLDSIVPAVMQATGARGVAIALLHRGDIVAQRTFGFADAERQDTLTADHTFNAASVSKAGTALAVMRLVEAGRVGLDDPVFRYVKRWRLPPSQWPDSAVTVRRLLSHTAGVNRASTGIWQVGEPLPTLEAAMSGHNNGYGATRLQGMPGTAFSYSGGGYSILQLLIEEVSATSLADHLQRSVLQPLGMSHSAYGWPSTIVAASATPYSELGMPLRAYRTAEPATGALNVTIGDLARLASIFVGESPGRGIVEATTIAQMMEAQPATDGRWGLGLTIERAADGRVFYGHDGGNPGWGAVFRVNAATGDGLVVLTNRSWGYEVYYPLLCAWRNATREAAQPERCPVYPLAAIATRLVEDGLAAGRARYLELLRTNPRSVGTAQMGMLARRFLFAGREADALEVARWNVAAQDTVAAAHVLVGDVLLVVGDSTAARERFVHALRLAPASASVKAKLDSLAARMPP